jgi:hypothetical protein
MERNAGNFRADTPAALTWRRSASIFRVCHFVQAQRNRPASPLFAACRPAVDTAAAAASMAVRYGYPVQQPLTVAEITGGVVWLAADL